MKTDRCRDASFGSSSEKYTPGCRVEIGAKGPRYCDGASGLGSKVSIWLGAPHSQTKMTDFARAGFAPSASSDGPDHEPGRNCCPELQESAATYSGTCRGSKSTNIKHSHHQNSIRRSQSPSLGETNKSPESLSAERKRISRCSFAELFSAAHPVSGRPLPVHAGLRICTQVWTCGSPRKYQTVDGPSICQTSQTPSFPTSMLL